MGKGLSRHYENILYILKPLFTKTKTYTEYGGKLYSPITIPSNQQENNKELINY